jgi:amino acid transporter
LTLAGVGIVLGSTWGPAGSSIVVALFNGGPPGVLYEFLAVSIFYWIVAASIAELASAIPSAGGVYHWASVTPGKKYGRVVGFFAGYWNWLAWVLGAASISAIAGELRDIFGQHEYNINIAVQATSPCKCTRSNTPTSSPSHGTSSSPPS